MGHERVGTLPRTKRWRDVVALLDQSVQSSPESIPTEEIASLTIEAAKAKLAQIQTDDGVARSFQFLVLLSVASQNEDPQAFLAGQGINIPVQATPLAMSLALRNWLGPVERTANPEFTTLARQSAVDTIAEWQRTKTVGQGRLFESGTDPFESWRQASQGRGFSELSRTFFAKFTSRYLNYFLSRVASDRLATAEQRDHFSAALDSHISTVADHAFETSKITQSFAAGWFNKNAHGEIPSNEQVKGFLQLAFSKIREELRREGAAR
jgi:hypothetical protein